MGSNLLTGRRILVSAIDLEQSEHRGIAVYSKGIIRSLHEAGAEVWLLTQFYDFLRDKGLRRLPRATRSMIRQARVLNDLANGSRERKQSFLENKLSLARQFQRWREYCILINQFIRRPRVYRARDLQHFRLSGLFDSPYPRVERLDYLDHIKGIVSAPDLYRSSQLAARMSAQRSVEIDLCGFDAFITTCPLNIRPRNVPVFIQTVHDLIPLEFVDTHDDPLMFSHRLQACIPARRLFVSHSTAKKFHWHISEQETVAQVDPSLEINPDECVIVQPPSLRFPSWLTADRDRVADLRPVCHFLRPPSEGNDSDPLDEPQANRFLKSSTSNAFQSDYSVVRRQRQKATGATQKRPLLSPFKYFLFNSSVESRKNLLFLAKAYAESDLYKEGVRLCVTGKLKTDAYSDAVRDIVSHEPGILLTGYVDESSKLDLYLNAMSLLSPSLVEGFGIPVLDSACLGMPALASDCESHREIESLYDFSNYILTLSTLDSREWAAAMQAIAGQQRGAAQNASVERRQRIARYQDFRALLYKQIEQDLARMLCQ